MKYSTNMQGHAREDFQLRFGVHDITDDIYEYKSGISRIKKHPDYDQNNLDHDIALVKLEQPVFTNEFVYPADLPCGR